MVKKIGSSKAGAKMLAPKKTAPKKAAAKTSAQAPAPRALKTQRERKPRGKDAIDVGGGVSFEGPVLYLSKKNAITAKEILASTKSKGPRP